MREQHPSVIGDFSFVDYGLQLLLSFLFSYVGFGVNLDRKLLGLGLDTPLKRLMANLLLLAVLTPVLITIHLSLVEVNDEFNIYKGGYFVRNGFTLITVLLVSRIMWLIKEQEEVMFTQKQAEMAKLKAEFENLRNQVAPHVLFNSLNTINFLTRKDPDKSIAYVNKLSHFLRYNLNSSEDEIVSLAKELDNLDMYLSLLNERYGGIIHLAQDIPPDYLKGKVLRLSMQELLENAVKHNVFRKTDPLTLHIRLLEEEHALEVKNVARPKLGEKTTVGSGLNNMSKRYEYLFDRKLRIINKDGYFMVILPLIL